MKVFVSGKITGEPILQCVKKFNDARKKIFGTDEFNLVRRDDIIVPIELTGIVFGISNNDAMSICFKALRECDAIYMLSDWENSPGARLEHSQAKDWGLQLYYQDKK